MQVGPPNTKNTHQRLLSWSAVFRVTVALPHFTICIRACVRRHYLGSRFWSRNQQWQCSCRCLCRTFWRHHQPALTYFCTSNESSTDGVVLRASSDLVTIMSMMSVRVPPGVFPGQVDLYFLVFSFYTRSFSYYSGTESPKKSKNKKLFVTLCWLQSIQVQTPQGRVNVPVPAGALWTYLLE